MMRLAKNGLPNSFLQTACKATPRRKIEFETLETRCLLAADIPGDALLLGDMNFDQQVDFDDVEPFVLGLNSPETYEAEYGRPPVDAGDINGDGRFDFDDIQGFENLLIDTRVHGIKWLDANGNGERDRGEPGLPGVTIYSDLNRNGELDRGEPHAVSREDDPSTERDESGRYRLQGLEPGIHVIREVVPDGFVQTFPPSPILGTSPLPFPDDGFHVIELEPGGRVDGIDFGNRRIDVDPGSAHGIKWLDRNGDGERNDDERGLPGVVIYSDLNRNGELDRGEPRTRSMRDNPETDFDESGMYWLEGLRPGEHVIREIVPDGFEQTFPFPFPGPDPGDPDIFPGDGAHFVILEPGGAVDGIDFGNRRIDVDSGSVHGIKWLDRNGDGERNDDERGLPGVVIYSDLNRNGELNRGEPRTRSMRDNPETDFDESGMYWLEGLRPGEHVIREIVPNGFEQTFPGADPAEPDIFPGDGAHFVILEPGGAVDGIDFGNRRIDVDPGSVHGIKWLDRNGDGERNDDERGLPGVVIYSDLNRNGELNRGEPRTRSMRDNPETDFDESGMYWLEGLRPGEHVIREIVPNGFEQTFPGADPAEPDIFPGDGAHFVILEPGGGVDGIDFGNRRIDVDPGSVHGIKWLDRNGDGERNDDERGLPGVVIYSDLNRNGELNRGEPRTRSMRDNPETDFDESGMYWLEGLRPGEHIIREIVPDGFEQTFPFPFPGPDPGDPDILPGDGAHFVILEPGDVIDGLDFGNRRIDVDPGSVHGIKWLDRNGDGERNDDEPGLPGVVIYSDLNRNGELDRGEPRTRSMRDIPETDFNEAGMYWLEGLRPGEHIIREIVPDGFEQTFPFPFPGPDPGDPDILPGDGAHFVILEPGDVIDGLDFGNRRIDVDPGSVHGIKWLDRNGDGERNDDEPGLPGVVIYSDLNRNGELDRGEPRTRSMRDIPETDFNEAGMYWLEGLRPGEHVIREVVPEGFEQTFPEPFLPPAVGDVLPMPHFARDGAHIVLVEPGGVIDGLDFGNRPIRPASVHGTKWFDENGNGEREVDEPGLPGVVIYSDLNFNGMLDDEEPRTLSMEDDPATDFDESGMYWLGELRPGEQMIREVVPDGFQQTFPPPFIFFPDDAVPPELGPSRPPLPGDGGYYVVLTSGGQIDGLDFGNQPVEPASVHGTKWLDENGNAERDPDEPGLAGVVIYSDLNFNGMLDDGEAQTVTMEDIPETDFDEAGLYWLEELRPGGHMIREVVPDGFQQTFPLSDALLFDDAIPSGPGATLPPLPGEGGHYVVLTSGAAVDGLDFGNRPVDTGVIHGRKWLDVDGNGRRDPGEPGLAGVTVYLDLNGDGYVTPDEPHTMTVGDNPFTRFDESGLYWFNDLAPGRYLVREIVPTGFSQSFPSVDDDGAHRVALGIGQVVNELDFGNRLLDFDVLPAVREAAAVGSQAWSEPVVDRVWESADDWLG